MQIQAVLTVVIAVTSIGCMLARPFRIPEAYWACGGAFLLVFTRLLPFRQAGHAVREGLDVYLFLTGMMILAELAQKEGVFEWVADIAGRHAHGSPSRLFLYVYLAGTVVTAFLSNDATAVVLTPAVLAVVRKAKVEPMPYLLACALIANAASFIFPISNPANLVVFAGHMPPLTKWLRTFGMPSMASIAITFLVLRFASRKNLKGMIDDLQEPQGIHSQGRLAMWGLGFASLVLMAASALGRNLGAPTCGAAIAAMLVVTWRDRSVPLTIAKGVSWAVLPLVAGLFVIVQALENVGMLRLLTLGLRGLEYAPRIVGNLIAGFSVGLLSNGMNNLPVGLISGAAVEVFHPKNSLANSLLIGVDLGPNLSVTGSLATILWLIALRRENAEITAWQFFKIGIVAMPFALLGSILALAR